MIKQIYQAIAIAWPLSLSLLHASALATTAQAGVAEGVLNNHSTQIDQNVQNNDDPLDFASDGRSGSRTGGGSRSECPSPDPPLTVLAPSSNLGTTISNHPTLWVYVPYTPSQASVGEFVLQTAQRDDIMRLPFTLPPSPGLVSVTVPESEAALLVEEEYLWYFNLYCDPDQNASPIYAQGWIRRLDANDDGLIDAFDLRSDQYYARAGIWFDALNELANLRRDRPSDPALLNDWHTLLNAPGITIELPDTEFAGAVEFQSPEQNRF